MANDIQHNSNTWPSVWAAPSFYTFSPGFWCLFLSFFTMEWALPSIDTSSPKTPKTLLQHDISRAQRVTSVNKLPPRSIHQNLFLHLYPIYPHNKIQSQLPPTFTFPIPHRLNHFVANRTPHTRISCMSSSLACKETPTQIASSHKHMWQRAQSHPLTFQTIPHWAFTCEQRSLWEFSLVPAVGVKFNRASLGECWGFWSHW